MASIIDDRAALIRNGLSATVDGNKTTATLQLQQKPPTIFLLPSVTVAPGSIIAVTLPMGGHRRHIVTNVTPRIGYQAAEVLLISTDFTAYDPATGNSITSGPCAFRSMPPGVLVPAAVAPPIGSLFTTGGASINPKCVDTLSITGGLATLTLGPAPPEYL